jgi:phage protein D
MMTMRPVTPKVEEPAPVKKSVSWSDEEKPQKTERPRVKAAVKPQPERKKTEARKVPAPKRQLTDAQAAAKAREDAAMRMRKVREDAERAAAERAAARRAQAKTAPSGDVPQRGRPQLRVVEGSAERRRGGA